MTYKELSNDEKIELVSKLHWDYEISPEEILATISNDEEVSHTFSKETLFVRSLETLQWEDIVNLWGLEHCIDLYTEKTRRMIFPKSLMEEYDIVFGLLRKHTLPASGQSAEHIEKLRSSLLFNRRNRTKPRIL